MKPLKLIGLIFLAVLLAAVVLVAVTWVWHPASEATEFSVLFECDNRSPVSMRVTGDASLYTPSLLESGCSLHIEKRTVTIRCPSARFAPPPLDIEGQRSLEMIPSK